MVTSVARFWPEGVLTHFPRRNVTVAMKRSFTLESASDRAQKFRKVGKLRIPLDQIGFLPENRGGVGIIPHHVHEVAHDISCNGTKLCRYEQVEVVEIPEHRRKDVIEFNKQKCEGCKLLPKYSPNIKYGTLGKTHFVHAEKLFQEGGHCFYGDGGKVRIRLREGDLEGRDIMVNGPICVIYDEKLLDDYEALSSIMKDDNLNASIQMQEDEMSAFGRTDAICDVLTKGAAHLDCSTVLDRLRASGLGVFSEQDWMNLIILRSKLPPNVAKLFMTCQFQAASGRVRVKCADFGLVGKLDSRFSWVKVAILLYQYVSTVGGLPLPGPSGASSLTFCGREEHFAKKLNTACMKQLEQDVTSLSQIEYFIRELLKHYKPPNDPNNHCDGDKLLSARSKLLSECGRLLLKVGLVLSDYSTKQLALSQSLKPEDTSAKRDEAMKGKFAKIEQNFRAGLLEAFAYTGETIPPAKHELTQPEHQEKAPGPRQTNRESHNLLMPADESQCVLTKADVLSRLDIDGPGGMVLISVFRARELLRPIKKELVPAKVESDGEAACAAAGVAGGSVVPSGAPIKKEPVPDKPASGGGAACADAGVAEVAVVPSSCASKQPSIDILHAIDTLHVHAKVLSFYLPQVQIVLQVDGADPGGVWVHADELSPVPSTTPLKQKVRPVEPALTSPDDVVETLPQYDTESTLLPFCSSFAGWALHWAMTAAQDVARDVSVLLLSEKGKLPYMFKVVANEEFKKGELVLPPSAGGLCRPDANAVVEASRKHKGIMHAAMKSSASLNVNISAKNTKTIEKEFVVLSPLHQGKSEKLRQTCYDNMPPYWAVCSAAASSSAANMEVDTVVLSDGLSGQVGQFPKLPRGSQIKVSMEVLRNVRKINKGDVLLLPFASRSEM